MTTCTQCGKPLPTTLDEYGPELNRPVCRDCWYQDDISEEEREDQIASLEDSIKDAETSIQNLEEEIADFENSILEWKHELREIKNKTNSEERAALFRWSNQLPLVIP